MKGAEIARNYWGETEGGAGLYHCGRGPTLRSCRLVHVECRGLKLDLLIKPLRKGNRIAHDGQRVGCKDVWIHEQLLIDE